MDNLEPLLKYISADNPGVERIIVIGLFLIGLWWIVQQFTKILKMHIDRMEQCNEVSRQLSEAVTQNTVQTVRVVDAVNQICFKIPTMCGVCRNKD